jgi:hypothetical protein
MFDDKYYTQVKQALENDGYEIIQTPFRFRAGGFKYQIDFAAKKDERTILIELKSFSGSFLEDFYTARGQYLTYVDALQLSPFEYDVYLAIPIDIYTKHFAKPLIKTILDKSKIKLVVYNQDARQIIEWIN